MKGVTDMENIKSVEEYRGKWLKAEQLWATISFGMQSQNQCIPEDHLNTTHEHNNIEPFPEKRQNHLTR